MRVADTLSLSRIAFAPVWTAVYFLSFNFEQSRWIILSVLLVVLSLVELTDFLDGYAARKLNQVSDIGKLLDPFCDTILHISIFLCFTVTRLMPAVVFLLIMWREFGMLFIRMVCIKNGTAIAARAGGKIKTVLYITSVFCALVCDIIRSVFTAGTFELQFHISADVLQITCTILFTLCAVAAYVSFIDYLIHFKKTISKSV
ncbi:CDP-diacylglycerol--glycerol-3-phosphate 3-phosphatidyltransferase [Spirochaetia bacterium]|nr:CDP-diacylglycerol--glycerol-3-phosphate 3-phosphatidyltransferase [Spirochaetia bacterium]